MLKVIDCCQSKKINDRNGQKQIKRIINETILNESAIGTANAREQENIRRSREIKKIIEQNDCPQ